MPVRRQPSSMSKHDLISLSQTFPQYRLQISDQEQACYLEVING